MPRFFTYGWQYAEARREPEGAPLGHAAGSRFSRRAIAPGALVYVVAVHRKQMYLLGKLEVGALVSLAEARQILGTEPYEAAEHLIARACTPARLIEVPMAVAEQLRFLGKARRLAFREDG